MPEDPDNGWRQRDCTRQMQPFDLLPEGARAKIRDGLEDTDMAALMRGIEQRGPSDRVRKIIRDRGLIPCDVPKEELIALELEQRFG